jgi:hypothetical protein
MMTASGSARWHWHCDPTTPSGYRLDPKAASIPPRRRGAIPKASQSRELAVLRPIGRPLGTTRVPPTVQLPTEAVEDAAQHLRISH